MSPGSQQGDRDQTAINTLRFLAVDMVEAANSGHPGAPLGQAAMAYTLWRHFLRYDPEAPDWPNRDRFVLSCGHASALHYALLHLAGYDLPLAELRRFRQLGSKTPGHPENFLTAGVETTTGPLGQGLSTAVGMAVAERMLAARFNQPGFDLFDHHVWVIASDGDLMEGMTHEASSLAGHLRLGKLNVLWDDNRISIDGSTDLAFTEDAAARYEAYGWHVLRVEDGNDLAALDAAMSAAREETSRPSFVVVRTHIGYGSPNKQDSAASHGSPLGAAETVATKAALGWPAEPAFLVPQEAREAFAETALQGADARRRWLELFASYREQHPELGAELHRALGGELPPGWQDAIPTFGPGSIATRAASGKVLDAIAPHLPLLVGGSADLAGSNNTWITGSEPFSAEHPEGRNFHFGVREHAMGAMLNGMALSGLVHPYGGTFLVFSDYMRPAIRLAALMKLPAIYVFTHDSIFLGEDGPTHQPISSLASLRSLPGLSVIRPADARETAEAWRLAIENRQGPTALVLTRQKLPILEVPEETVRNGVAHGGYILEEASTGEPRLILIATGSEVSLALGARQALEASGTPTRVVSLPSWDRFDRQDKAYRRSVLPVGIPRLGIEAASPFGWERYLGEIGDNAGIVAMHEYGASAPAEDLAKHFGFTVENVVARAKELVG